MADIKISRNAYVPKENVEFYVAYASRPVYNDVKKKKEQGLVYDYTSGKKANTVIYLKSGRVIIVNTAVETINARMDPQPGKEE